MNDQVIVLSVSLAGGSPTRRSMDPEANADGDDGEEAKAIEIVLQLGLFIADVGLRNGAAVGIDTGVVILAAGSGDVVVDPRRREILESDLRLEGYAPLLVQIMPMVTRGATLLPPKTKVPLPVIGPAGLVTALYGS